MADLLRADRAQALVLVDGGAGLRVTDLLRNVARIAAALPPATPGSHIAFAFDRDRAAFLAALLAAWHKGHAAAVPPNARFSTVGPVLARAEVALLLHDTGAGTGMHVPRLLADPSADDAALPEVLLAGPLTVFSRQPNGALLGQHLTAAMLQELLTRSVDELRLPPAAVVCNTFGPAFPPALLLGLLAPLAAGATIVGEDNPSLTAPRLRHLAPHTLVAAASQLRTLAHSDAGPDGLAQVVAADADLDQETAARLRSRRISIAATTRFAAGDPRRTAIEHALLARPGAFASSLDLAAAIAELPTGPHAFAAVVAPLLDPAPTTVLGMPLEVRAVRHSPRDRDGQVDTATLLLLFDRAADGSTLSRTLQFDAVPSADGERRHFRTRLPHDFFAFAGHFPGYPVLSGAAQLHELVLPCLCLVRSGPVVVTAFADLKFLSRIAPGDTVEIVVQSANDSDVVDFEILRAGVRCSAGRATVREALQGEEAP